MRVLQLRTHTVLMDKAVADCDDGIGGALQPVSPSALPWLVRPLWETTVPPLRCP